MNCFNLPDSLNQMHDRKFGRAGSTLFSSGRLYNKLNNFVMHTVVLISCISNLNQACTRRKSLNIGEEITCNFTSNQLQ